MSNNMSRRLDRLEVNSVGRSLADLSLEELERNSFLLRKELASLKGGHNLSEEELIELEKIRENIALGPSCLDNLSLEELEKKLEEIQEQRRLFEQDPLSFI